MNRQKEIIGDCTLYLGDCMDILPVVGTADLIITDPPYLLSSSGPGKSHFGMSLHKFDDENYKSIVNGIDYQKVFAELDHICQPFNLFCFCSNKQISSLMRTNEAAGRITTLLVWHKINSAPFANGVWRGDLEYVVHARDTGAVFQGGAELKKKQTEHPLVNDRTHPTVKPIPILQKYIKIGSRENQVVIDPFMGSGTTGAACAMLDRQFIGIEKEPKYFDIACKRIEQAYQQPDMFVEQPQQVEQVELL